MPALAIERLPSCRGFLGAYEFLRAAIILLVARLCHLERLDGA